MIPQQCTVCVCICADLYWVDFLNESLQGRHPAGCQVTVLEKDPLPFFHGSVHHGLSPGALNHTDLT